MKTAPKESAITARLLKELHFKGIFAWKNHGSLYSKAGIPDLSVVLRGVTLYIEMKRPGETSTPIQKSMQAKLREAGAPVYEAHGWEEALDWVLHYEPSDLPWLVRMAKPLTPPILKRYIHDDRPGLNAFAEEEAAVADARIDHRVPLDLACPNCGARSTEVKAVHEGWECPTCGYMFDENMIAARVSLKRELGQLDAMARGPVGALVKKFATKKKGPE